ncbi:MAG: InlB B-repeat-containing protein [Paludibacteraceae bacterium]|nr:InlB B-repeat-containing protein [Paludibacteraceae bacterium]
MTKVTDDDDCEGKIYKAEISDDYTHYIFCRMNGTTTANNWDNKWDQTADLDDTNMFFQVDNWDNKTGDKSYCVSSRAPFKVCVGGTRLRFTGETISLTAACTGATHFQWYKDGTAEENKIVGATDAIFTKVCAVGDGGHYYCKAWTIAGQEATSAAYDVHVPFIEYQTPPAPSDPHNNDYKIVPLTRVDENAEEATGTCYPGVAWTYAYSVSDGLGYHGNWGTMTSDNCNDWVMDKTDWCRWETTKEGIYTFKVKFNNTEFTNYTVSVDYPPMVQTADRPIYVENTLSMGWNPEKIYYRLGKGQYLDGDNRNWTSAKRMTLVPGTARYFETKTFGWSNNFWVWHICNNRGDIDNKYAIYKTIDPQNASDEITNSSRFIPDEVPEGGWTVYINVKPTDETGKTCSGGYCYNTNCYFHDYSHSPGMLMHSVSIGATEHGQLQIEWVDKNDYKPEPDIQVSKSYDARTLTDLAHTCILKITADPDCGYKLASLKINNVDYHDGDTCIVQVNKAIVATFTEATYTVTFNTNGGTINSDYIENYTFPESVTLPADVTRDGYEFLGWYDNEACSGSPVTDIAASSCENKEYWAKWKAGKPAPVFTWTYDDIVKAGGIYDVKVASTGDAPVTLTIVEAISGVDGTFTVGNPATGTVTIGSYPAATTYTYRASSPETANYKAKTEEKTVTITICETAYAIPMALSKYVAEPSASGTHARYYCEVPGVGRLSKKTGNSTISNDNFKSGTNDIFEYYIEDKALLIEPYSDIHKIELYVNCGTNNKTLDGVYTRDTYSASDGGYTIVSPSIKYYKGSAESAYLPYNAIGHVEMSFATPIPKGTFIYIVSPKQMNIYGVKLYRAEGDEPTVIEFGGEAEIEKYPGDAPFTNTATQTTTPILSAGTITYKSSDETVAIVDANTGEVTVQDLGRTTITATLNTFGCFKGATASYSLVVKKCSDPACTIAVIAGKANKCPNDNVTLTATAADGAAIQWFKDGVALSGKTGTTLTTKDAGIYHAEARKGCLQVSNKITVTNFTAPTATALHDYYYIRAGRTTPDIALFKLTNVDVTDPDHAFQMNRPAPTGCAYVLREDGIVYLTGTPDESLTVDDYEIVVTAMNPCGLGTATANMHIYQIIQGRIAWVGCGNKGAGPANAIPASQSTDQTLYQYLCDYYELVRVNAYWTTDEQQISDYYSQFDLVLLTDYPDTQVTPTSDKDRTKSYSNAIGSLIDKIPILSLEAFVAGCPHWGINTNPRTPKPKQKEMTLLCSAHNIFAGTHLTTDEKTTVLSEMGGEGLQGFTGLEAPPGMLFIATIADTTGMEQPVLPGEENSLIVCCERQKVIEARMIIMGVNSDAMAKLNADGKLIIKQIVDYLLQFKDIADCAMVFDNGANNITYDESDYHASGLTGTKGDGKWSTAANWHPAYNAVPKPFQAVRVDKPCNVDIETAHCSSIRLRKDGSTWNGKLTIQPDGGLTVIDGIKEVHGKNFMTTYPSAAADLVIQANNVGRNGSLVFGNNEDDLAATVEYYSLAKDANVSDRKPVWQYIGIPVKDRPMAIDAYHAAWMCGWESEGEFVSSNWVWVENEDRIQPFKGYCITQKAQKKYTHRGNLCLPETKELPLYYFDSDMDGPGFNMFANSWVAPIDITKMTSEDFGSGVEPTIFIYNTGTRAQYDDIYPDPLTDPITTDGDGTAPGQFNAIPVNAASYMDGSLQKIPTMQGFFVRTANESSLTLDYKRICFDSETHNTTAETMRAPQRKADEEPATEKIVPEVMRLDVRSANWGDRVYILSHHEFSDAFDRGWDGTKQEGDADAPMLAFVQESGLLAVAAVESADDRYLSFRAGHDSIYTFTFDYNGEKIYLYDQLTRQATQIRTGNTYTFVAHNETAANRFLITTTPPMMPTDIEVVETDDGLHVENYGEQPVQISIVDMQGRILYNMHTTQAVLDIRPLLPAGVYVAYIVAGDKKQVIKLIGGESK